MILDQHQQPDPAMCRVCRFWRGDREGMKVAQQGGLGLQRLMF